MGKQHEDACEYSNVRYKAMSISFTQQALLSEGNKPFFVIPHTAVVNNRIWDRRNTS